MTAASPAPRQHRTRQPQQWEVSDLLALSDERDLWQRLALARERAAYRQGLAEGIARGREIQARIETYGWGRHARASTTAVAFSQLERRRWGNGGREHFADPRPGDFPGTGRD